MSVPAQRQAAWASAAAGAGPCLLRQRRIDALQHARWLHHHFERDHLHRKRIGSGGEAGVGWAERWPRAGVAGERGEPAGGVPGRAWPTALTPLSVRAARIQWIYGR